MEFVVLSLAERSASPREMEYVIKRQAALDQALASKRTFRDNDGEGQDSEMNRSSRRWACDLQRGPKPTLMLPLTGLFYPILQRSHRHEGVVW